ncbi:hypothetical protein Dxin01_03572 [Deinococcus xinjiangensis]|uniref:PsbP C-terminal domain-containing protein n=1 Tax=Deinococcus xinjiangensis TaxID=457454 RepID=A0ABP9VF07_9DEIO
MKLTLVAALALGVTLAGISLAQTQVAPETHPVGDIPDSQAFVRYASAAGHYSLEVPEGWARSVKGTDVSFTSKLGGVAVLSSKASAAPTVGSVKAREVPLLGKTIKDMKVVALKDVKLPAGPAVLVKFTSTGAVNAVTGRATRQENDLYVLAKNGTQVMLRFSAPLGADNVDAWKRMADSFQWK